jgi:hypothetical protein
MKEQIDLLQSFEPVDRARAGSQLVAADLGRSADPLLDHVANEFDDRVLAAIARAVVATPAASKESRRVQELRAWAESELERLALEEAFLGREPEPVEFQFDRAATAPAPAERLPQPSSTVPVAPVLVEAVPAAPPTRHHISWRVPGAGSTEEAPESSTEAAPAAVVWRAS